MAKYHPNSMRANEARVGKVANSMLVKALLVLTLIALLSFGGALLFLHKPLGWALIGFAFVPLELLIWTKYELKMVPTGKSDSIDDLLSNECLVHMGKHPTPQQVAKWYIKTRSGNFLAMRYSITPRFMEAITEAAPQDMT
ncbi:hypothetical protein J6X09_01005, partial [Candidatus Saccharibacteria bacterium]|nr:hypothetical protein [Candidatus Saccharibacteria bacterium]